MLPTRRGRRDEPLRSQRSCVLARSGMACASVPAAAEAAATLLRSGGNAFDAAIAGAAALCVVEPMMTGLGGDAFALAWSADEGGLIGLNGSGRAPSGASPEAIAAAGLSAIPEAGILAATVPGAVHAWQTLHDRAGRTSLAECLAPAIALAEEGYPVSELVAHDWQLVLGIGRLQNDDALRVFSRDGKAPAAGTVFRTPALAATLRAIAQGGATAFYEGRPAEAIVATSEALGGGFSAADLREHRSTWVEPLRIPYRDATVVELPPNGQGLTALLALGMLAQREPAAEGSALAWHERIEAVKRAMADRDAYVADPDAIDVPVDRLLDEQYLRERAATIGGRASDGALPGLGSDTTYLCTADADGNLVSFIQSLFGPFGSGVGCGDTGVVLQNRGFGFRLDPDHPNVLAPGKRPFHTIIPGMLLRGGEPRMAFGIMGGHVQAQAHTAFVSNVVDHGCNPQEALDAPRFRYDGGRAVWIESPDGPVSEGGTLEEALAARGHEVRRPLAVRIGIFGGGQAIERLPSGVLVGASDRRKDGCARGVG